MPVCRIEAPPGIGLNAKKKMFEKITSAIACHGERPITARQMPDAISTSLRGTVNPPFL